MPRQFLDGAGKYLEVFAPDREDEVLAAIDDRAEELVEENKEMATDGPRKGALAISAVALAAYEQLLTPGPSR